MIDADSYISRLQRFLVEHEYDKNKELMELIDSAMMENMRLFENIVVSEKVFEKNKKLWYNGI